MKASTLEHFQKTFQNTPAVDFNSYYSDPTNLMSWHDDLDDPFINTLPQGTILLSVGLGGQDSYTFLVKTPEGQYFIVNEDESEATLVEADESTYSIEIPSEYYTHTLFTLSVDYEDLIVFLNSHLTNEDFGQMIEVTQEDADKYPLK